MKTHLLALALAVFSLSAFAADAKSDLVGVWKLESFRIKDAQKKDVDWCKGAHGFLMYTADGHMSAAINCEPPAGKRLLYGGRYEIENGKDIVHHVTNGHSDDLIGKNLVRHIERVDAHELILTGDFGGPFRISWRR